MCMVLLSPKNFNVTQVHFTSLQYLVLLLSEGQADEAGNQRTELCCFGGGGGGGGGWGAGRKSTSTLRDLRFPPC